MISIIDKAPIITLHDLSGLGNIILWKLANWLGTTWLEPWDQFSFDQFRSD